jgi:23S rRNA (cytidine1920-2'-O)/16S rRNA (cytidine1409-2'-O)-methyltransferase
MTVRAPSAARAVGQDRGAGTPPRPAARVSDPPAQRLDQWLVTHGQAASRGEAQAAIMAGTVTVDGQVVDKPGYRVRGGARVTVRRPAHPYVGRGGVKLAHALAVFRIDPRGRTAADLGASTGGFTDCLLQAGAARVYAIDVGHGQLAWRLRTDPRVVVLEGLNARALAPVHLGGPVDLVTVDLSFISLRLVWPAIFDVLSPGGDVIALVKPQFEAGRQQVRRGGIVRDPAVHATVLRDVLDAAASAGLEPRALTPSPITGPAGNIEYLAHLRRRDGASRVPSAPVDISAVVAEAHAWLAAGVSARSRAATPSTRGRAERGRR